MTALADRFVCRREGHEPAIKLTAWSGAKVTHYFTTCKRCGKWIEVKV